MDAATWLAATAAAFLFLFSGQISNWLTGLAIKYFEWSDARLDARLRKKTDRS